MIDIMKTPRDGNAIADCIRQSDWIIDLRVLPDQQLTTGMHWEDEILERAFKSLRNGIISRMCFRLHKEALAFFSPPAFEVALPRFLIYSLRHPESEVATHTVLQLAKMDFRVIGMQLRYPNITKARRNVVCEAVRWIRSQRGDPGGILNDFERIELFWCS